MFVYNRSALAVLAPLALLAAAVFWSSRSTPTTGVSAPVAQVEIAVGDQTVAANLPSR